MKKMLTGNTYRHTFNFNDWDSDVLVEPDVVKFIVYDEDFNVLEEHILSTENEISTGVYRYYHIAATPGKVWLEWYGEIGGYPTLQRKQGIISDTP